MTPGSETVNAQSLEEHVERLARVIARARPRVLGLLADNGSEWLAADLAAERAGVPLVPLPAFFTLEQARHAAAASGMDALLGESSRIGHTFGFGSPAAIEGSTLGWFRREAAPVALPAGTAKITFTSGTTGTPKGVCLGAAQQRTVARALEQATRPLGLSRHLCLLPLPILLENVAGARTALLSGEQCVVPPLAAVGMSGATGFDPVACLAAIERWRAESVILLPQMLLELTAALEAGAPRPPRLRFAAVGGAKIAPALLERARAAGLPAFEGYGLTECASVVSLNLPGADRPGSVGRPLPHTRVRIAADGEILVSGSRCLGYLDGGADGPADEWLPTGDSGRIDADGFLHVEGRRKHVLITSFGRNVAPEWPEAELAAGEAIAQAAVFGEGRPRLCAVIVPRLSAATDAAIEAEVRRANGRLPDYAQVAFWMRAEAPFSAASGLATANGRVRRDAVWSRYGGRLEALYPAQATGPMSNAMPFFEELHRRTAAERESLFAIPVIQDCLAGRVTREQYLAFLTQAYHHVKHTVPLLMACGARLPDTHAWLLGPITQYIAEESGHEEWILNDIAAAGGDVNSVRTSSPDRAAELLVAYVYDYIARRNPLGFFGMVHVLEGTSQALATRAAQVMRESLGLPPEAFTYLASHGTLDQEHVRFFAGLMNRLDAPADREAVTHVARTVFRLYGDIFRDLPQRSTASRERVAA
jgi:acyl-CoA synthetase (AMP-forming)/AMP-acid ligase II/pyrroloquinoline quinone (PQQ) biosynthesis protein C